MSKRKFQITREEKALKVLEARIKREGQPVERLYAVMADGTVVMVNKRT
jgi:hypothetical protein